MPTTLTPAELIREPPLVHADGFGAPTTYQLATRVLEYLATVVQAGDATLETGEGVSTILCAMLGARHTCVTPNGDAVGRIRAYCDSHHISLDHVTFAMGLSEEVLPTLGDAPLDLVVIDGSHSLPATFIDWYYAGRRLRVGGLVVVDDVQLWPCALLAEFLESEPMWREVFSEPGRTRVFERTQPGELIRHWQLQPLVVAETERRSHPMSRTLGTKAGNAWRLLRARRYSTILEKVRKNLQGR